MSLTTALSTVNGSELQRLNRHAVDALNRAEDMERIGMFRAADYYWAKYQRINDEISARLYGLDLQYVGQEF